MKIEWRLYVVSVPRTDETVDERTDKPVAQRGPATLNSHTTRCHRCHIWAALPLRSVGAAKSPTWRGVKDHMMETRSARNSITPCGGSQVQSLPLAPGTVLSLCGERCYDAMLLAAFQAEKRRERLLVRCQIGARLQGNQRKENCSISRNAPLKGRNPRVRTRHPRTGPIATRPRKRGVAAVHPFSETRVLLTRPRLARSPIASATDAGRRGGQKLPVATALASGVALLLLPLGGLDGGA